MLTNPRLCVLFQIINLLVHFEPASLCESDSEIALSPLPTQKQVWEASDEHAWKLESETESDANSEFALTKNGSLLRLNEGEDAYANGLTMSCNNTMKSHSMVKWNEWYSGMDSIGGLVMLAASLIH